MTELTEEELEVVARLIQYEKEPARHSNWSKAYVVYCEYSPDRRKFMGEYYNQLCKLRANP